MKRTANRILLLQLAVVVALCTGCLQRRAAALEATASEVTDAEVAEDRSQQPVSAIPGLDSIVCAEGCTGYTCYFMAGTRNKKALEHIQSVVYGYFSVDVDSDDDPASIDRYRTRYLDSLSSLEWLDSEPWPSVRQLFLDWSKQQCDRFYIVSRAERDPAILYNCSEKDSVLTRCADILTKGGAGYVDAVRRLLRESEFAKAARDSVAYDRSYLEITLAQIDRVLADPDSTENARERLFVLLSNHINYKIHDRLGKNGTVDFFSYSDDFLRIFDSVRVETYEP